MQWLAYRRGGVGIERRARLTALMGMSMAGTRPRELDADTLRQVLDAADGNEVLTDMGAWFYAYARELDRADVAAAGVWLQKMEDAVDGYPDGFRQGIAVELALHAALHRHDEAGASRWLARARGGIVDASRRHLAEAALAAVRGNQAGAPDPVLRHAISVAVVRGHAAAGHPVTVHGAADRSDHEQLVVELEDAGLAPVRLVDVEDGEDYGEVARRLIER